jgi:hypothetical protein
MQREKHLALSREYGGETKTAAIVQNFFVGRFAVRPFSKFAAA